jgi:hypothetical protein
VGFFHIRLFAKMMSIGMLWGYLFEWWTLLKLSMLYGTLRWYSKIDGEYGRILDDSSSTVYPGAGRGEWSPIFVFDHIPSKYVSPLLELC